MLKALLQVLRVLLVVLRGLLVVLRGLLVVLTGLLHKVVPLLQEERRTAVESAEDQAVEGGRAGEGAGGQW